MTPKPSVGARSMSSRDARQILDLQGGRAPWVRHCEAVAEVASVLAQALTPACSVDLHFVWRAALLHDVGRCRTHDPILHGVEGYRILADLGYPAEASVCASHILYGLEADEARRYGLPARPFVPDSHEECLVPLADFLVEGDRSTTLELRFASLRARNGGEGAFLEGLGRAEQRATSYLMEFERLSGSRAADLARQALAGLAGGGPDVPGETGGGGGRP